MKHLALLAVSAAFAFSPLSFSPMAPAHAAQKGCISAAKGDKDLRRQKIALAGACVKKQTVKDGKRKWTIYTITRGKPGPLWAVLHDNENAAFDGAVSGMNTKGGTIVAVETGERRMFKGKDPNRNFGRKCGNAKNYTAFMMRLAAKSRGVVAMHSNANGYSGGGGSGHINIYRKSKVLIGYPSKKAKGALKDGDNFVLVPGKGKLSGAAKRKVNRLNKNGVHAMYERVTRKGNDCSFSNHMVLQGKSNYVNVEVQHGQSKTARSLIPHALGAL